MKSIVITQIIQKQKEKGITNYRLAKMCDMDRSTIKRLYDGAYDDVKLSVVLRICKALDINKLYLNSQKQTL